MIAQPILFLVGLTGVGKSSTLDALEPSAFSALPNRRVLTDQIIIPALQLAEGSPQVKVSDRLERFRLTAQWRARHPAGMVAALLQYLDTQTPPEKPYLFDNIRGLNEVRAANETFEQARFIFLDAPPQVRLKRLLRRSDSFDKVRQPHHLPLHLQDLKGLEDVFDPSDIAQLAESVERERLQSALNIIIKEQQNYNAAAAATYLREALPPARYLYLDTSRHSLEAVVTLIRGWL